jgi:outer membrane receptor for ferrienterochelin and colicins
MMTRRIPRSLATLSALALVLSLAGTASAQAPAGEDTTIFYPADYFTEYAPITAKDMVDRIPGAGNASGGGGGGGPRGGGNPGAGGRGLGGGGGDNQVLINGKRTAGKDNDTNAMLTRINASQVDRIELIRGTSGALDVRGGAQIINVVLFEELSNTSISYEANMDRYADHQTEPGGSLSVSGQSGALNYLFAMQAEPRYDHYVSKENSILGNFQPNDIIREDRIREQTDYRFTTNLGYDITANSSLRLNALFGDSDSETALDRVTTNLRVLPNTLSYEREDTPGRNQNWEVGGDYEWLSDNGDRFKVLFITNERDQGTVRERYRVNADGSETKNLFLDSGSVAQERIVRSSYTTGLAAGQDIEFGLERAQTILDSSLRLGTLSTTGIPSAAFGGLVPQNVANSNTKVEEIRYEPFATHNWQINSRMSLESSLVYETSELTQSGDVNKSRDFDFWKPKVDYRFDVTPMFQLRGMVEFDVKQLSFSDFVASGDNDDNDMNTEGGNANLEPETWINADFDAQYRLPDDIGVVSARVNFMRHFDKIERIDVSSPTALAATNGNMGDGDMWQLILRSSIRMKMIDMPNLLVTANFTVRDSEIKDPFLGLDRRFTNYERGRLELGFRHDLPQWRMNYGLSWNNRFDGNIKRYDLEDIELTAGDPMVMAFVEYIAFGNTTIRFDVRNATDNLQCRERQRFVGRISANILEEIEDQCGGSGRVLALKINGTF